MNTFHGGTSVQAWSRAGRRTRGHGAGALAIIAAGILAGVFQFIVPGVLSPRVVHARVANNGSASRIAGDFNGDGYPDLAVADDSANNYAGQVDVYYGGPAGLDTKNPQVFTDTQPWVPSQLTNGAFFGFALAAGDYNGDGYSDLAIGLIGAGSGAVVVLHGSAAGLTTTGSQLIMAPSSMSSNAEFGRALASGDFNHDGYADLAIAAPLDDGVVAEEGAVTIMYGSSSGLTGGMTVTESSPGIPGPAPTRYDNLGWNMAVGDFKRSGYADLALVEGENKCAVAVLYGSSSGISFAGAQYLQAVGCADYADRVAVGDFNGNGFDDLAIGEPYGGTAGMVEVHYGSASGLGNVAYGTAQKIMPGTKGMPAEPSKGGYFGTSMVAGDVKHNGHADLIVGGAPAGTIVLWGTSTKLTASGSRIVGDPGASGLDFPHVLGLGDFSGSGFADLVDCPSSCDVFNGASTGLPGTATYSLNQLPEVDTMSVPSNHAAW